MPGAEAGMLIKLKVMYMYVNMHVYLLSEMLGLYKINYGSDYPI